MSVPIRVVLKECTGCKRPLPEPKIAYLANGATAKILCKECRGKKSEAPEQPAQP